MNETTSRLVTLLKSPRPDIQMASVLVLGELAPRDASVARALAGMLGTSGRGLRLNVLDSLARIASPAAVPDLLPLLETGDEDVRERATRALTQIGPAAIKPIASQIVDAPPGARRALLAVLSRVKTAESVGALMSLVESGHPEASREAGHALASLSQTMTRAEQARLRATLDKVLKVAPEKSPAGAFSAALQVMATVGQSGAVSRVVKLTGSRYPETVRRDALLALAGMMRGNQLPGTIMAAVMPIIQEGPSAVLRSAALEVLGSAELPSGALDAFLKLLDSRDPAVRRFAARRLGTKEMGGVRASRRLIQILSDADPSMRDAASESLGRLPDATGLLLEELQACDDVHRGWALAYILKHHVSRLRKPQARAVFDRAVSTLLADDRIWEPLLYVVRHHDPKLMYSWLMEESLKLRKARKYADAENLLKPLSRGDHFDSEARFALALSGIKATRSKQGAAPGGNHSFELFRQLVRDPTFPLVDRLKKERAHLETEDLYFLGFQLSEGSPDEKEVGGELLKIVAARAGTSKLGKSARSKLRSEGLVL